MTSKPIAYTNRTQLQFETGILWKERRDENDIPLVEQTEQQPVAMKPLDEVAVMNAAKQANRRYGQWIPGTWIRLFMEEYNAQKSTPPSSDLDRLREEKASLLTKLEQELQLLKDNILSASNSHAALKGGA